MNGRTGSTLGTVWVGAPRGNLWGTLSAFWTAGGGAVRSLERRIVTYGLGPKAIVWDVEENRPVKLNIEHRAPYHRRSIQPRWKDS